MPYKSEQLINWVPDNVAVFHEKRLKRLTDIEYEHAVRIIKRTEKGYSVQSRAIDIPFETTQFDQSIAVIDRRFASGTIRDVGRFPVIPFTPTGIGWSPEIIPLSNLAEANYDHYRISASVRQAIHNAPHPVYYAIGFGTDGELKIGSGRAWVAKSAPQSSEAGLLEYRGWAIEWMLATLSNVEATMVAFGARMLEHDKRASETAEALRQRQASQEANIIGLVRSQSQGLTLGCKTLLAYRNNTTIDRIDLDIELPTDLVETRLTSGEIIALVNAWQSGALPDVGLEFNLRQGELLPNDMDTETFQSALRRVRAMNMVAAARDNLLSQGADNGRE